MIFRLDRSASGTSRRLPWLFAAAAVALATLSPTRAHAQVCNGNTAYESCLNAIGNVPVGGPASARDSRRVIDDIFRTNDSPPLFGPQLVFGQLLLNKTLNYGCAGASSFVVPGFDSTDPRVYDAYSCTNVPQGTYGNYMNGLDWKWGQPIRLTPSGATAGDGSNCGGDLTACGYMNPWQHGFIFDLQGPANRVVIFPITDHVSDSCLEAFEYSVYLTDNPDARSVVATGQPPDATRWNRAVLTRGYLKGWTRNHLSTGSAADMALHPLGTVNNQSSPRSQSYNPTGEAISDSIATVWSLPCGTTFRYAAIVSGNYGNPDSRCTFHSFDSELDAVAGINEDFTGLCPDRDRDGFPDMTCGGTDCDDTNPNIKPTASEDCRDVRDVNCDGRVSACPAGTACFQGACAINCTATTCPSGSTCTTIAGSIGQRYCVPTACAAVTCNKPARCTDRGCEDPCAGVICPLGQACLGGACVATCSGVVCPPQQHCENGGCVPDCDCAGCPLAAPRCNASTQRCETDACATLVCSSGLVKDCSVTPPTCRPPGCTGVVCPMGQACDPNLSRCVPANEVDTDRDTVPDVDEKPGGVAIDTDMDSLPNWNDPDDDGDGLPTINERPARTDRDTDGDGLIDRLDPDDDGDTIPTNLERTQPSGSTPAQDIDTDGDRVPDHLDPDDDNDGILTATEARLDVSVGTDFDGDGRVSYRDTDSDGDTHSDALEAGGNFANPVDTDRDGAPDFLDVDSDNDCLADSVESPTDRINASLPAGAHCQNPNPVCAATGTQGRCGPCNSTSQCPSGLFCATSGARSGQCVQCLTNAQCTNPTLPRCDATLRTCVADNDSDGDGILDMTENRFGTNPNNPDSDMDGVPDGTEYVLWPTTPPNDQSMIRPVDTDGDGAIDALDPDDDGDSVPTRTERPGNTDVDSDRDGKPDYLDPDDDGDRIPTRVEVTLDRSTGDDFDTDGRPSYLDEDSDADGYSDLDEAGSTPNSPVDSDRDGAPDFLDTDSDNDCVADRNESTVTRTNAALPPVPCANPTPVCNVMPNATAGVCGPCNADTQCAAPTPFCARASARMGQCVQCLTNANCGGATPRCDANLNTCVADNDSDGDGITDMIERMIGTDPNNPDSDFDGVPDGTEVGPTQTSPQNTDGDANIDALDPDDDGDGLPTRDERPNGLDRDTDADNVPDYLDTDDDGDRIPTATEIAADTSPGDDFDGDRIPSYLDRDSDGDGAQDVDEAGVAPRSPRDTDRDMAPDFLDLDSDNDCVADRLEGATPRVDATQPPGSHCGIQAPRCLVQGTVGVCTPCTADTDCAQFTNATNALGSTTFCQTTGARAGQCVGCLGSTYCASLSMYDAPVCDPMLNKCVGDMDSDGDGLPDTIEVRSDLRTNPRNPDTDGDGVPDGVEVNDGNSPHPAVGSAFDTDRDGIIDALDTDDDNDTIPTRLERPFGMDQNSDGDASPNYRDSDDDNDEIPTAVELARDPTINHDFDRDGIPSHLDLDSDNDRVVDTTEYRGTAANPGTPNNPSDYDRDGNPDFLDFDSDNDCVPDRYEDPQGRLDPSRPAEAINPHCLNPVPFCDRTGTEGQCRRCAANTDCPSGTPVCDRTSGSCVGCVLNTDCPTGSSCDATSRTCTGCTSGSMCPESAPVCDLMSTPRRCVACQTDAECQILPNGASRPVCAVNGNAPPAFRGQCVECTATNSDRCTTANPICNETLLRCVPCVKDARGGRCSASGDGELCLQPNPSAPPFCGCERDDDCGPADSGKVCDPSTSRCVSGCRNDRTPPRTCQPGFFCLQTNTSVPGVCTQTCTSNLDCRDMGTRTVCLMTGVDGGMGSSMPNRCVECANDTNCAGRSDGRTQCIGANNTCAQCSTTNTTNCSANGQGVLCLTTGVCGCETDDHCSPDRRCDRMTSQCVPRGDAGMPDAADASSGGDDAGDAGGNPSDASAMDEKPTALTGSGACTCSTVGASRGVEGRAGGWVLGLVLAALSARRAGSRRRARA